MDEVNNAVERDELGRLWLALIKKKLKDETINATEQAILARVLIHSGFTIDPTRLPKDLRSKLTENIDPEELEEFGEDVIGRIA